ncbi:MAG: antibiotic biosynthesis monooxygenase [Acidobacteria bacterium]|nr:antibiotic biosynthesis monooxygenase [Acidobacteriota bacterium]
MILASIRMTIPPEKNGEVMKILGWVVELCRDDPNCLKCNLLGDLRERNVLVLEQVWRAQESLDLHLRSEEYRNLLMILELSLEKPEIRFDTISDSTGIETIERARSAGKSNES